MVTLPEYRLLATTQRALFDTPMLCVNVPPEGMTVSFCGGSPCHTSTPFSPSDAIKIRGVKLRSSARRIRGSTTRPIDGGRVIVVMPDAATVGIAISAGVAAAIITAGVVGVAVAVAIAVAVAGAAVLGAARLGLVFGRLAVGRFGVTGAA